MQRTLQAYTFYCYPQKKKKKINEVIEVKIVCLRANNIIQRQ